MKQIIVAGIGALGKSFFEHIDSVAKELNVCVELFNFEEISPNFKITKETYLVHTGSGRLLQKAFDWCSDHSVPLIQASTGINFEFNTKELKMVYLEAPNLSLSIIKFIYLMKQVGLLFKDTSIQSIQIEESHQASKKTVPGTAQEIAKGLRVPASEIKSIRDPLVQLERHIPKEHLNGHAAHWITINSLGTTLSFQTQVLGRKAYTYGLVELTSLIKSLKPGYYNVVDLIEN